MAFRSARVNADESAADRRDSATAWQDAADSADSPAAGGRDQSPAPVDAFGVDPTKTQRATLQRAAKQYGNDDTRQWAAEGMPTDAMGTPSEMAAFRERQQARPAAVPHDIEQQNEASLHRNKAAHRDHEPAGEAAVPESVREVVSEPGQQLEGEVKAGLEQRLDASLDHVQIHTGPTAQQACEEVNARAFAVGNHIAFGPGEYDPESPKGQHLIAHEVVHTLQQPAAPISMMPKTEVGMEVDPDPAAEREADEIAGQIMRGWETGLEGEMADTEIHVQRFTGAIADIGSTAASMVKLNHEAQKNAQEAEAESYAQMGGTEGSLEDRVENLEKQVSKLGEYVSEQVAPASTKRQMVTEAGKDALSSGAGLATGAGIAALGLAGPLGAIAGAALAGAATKGMMDTSSAVSQTAKQVTPDWLDEWGDSVTDRLPKWLGGRDEDEDQYHGGNEIDGIR
ncbi:DUF4157 domain-containing protein [Salinadaptatus halalkaliphilus]|uniref:DUF4157 domain-containing protein n=1 Tax=Salinadaptatus halalkaliphilus TaxID=2419781 RepID=A0A4S3TNN1_9EURY|nr:DUF4157 domain-containing protein [Salinadaptatus halalkaliphilus]THE64833.1 DUF4157 domain-containing protein [Salinadaptatus halalkaliphilus]